MRKAACSLVLVALAAACSPEQDGNADPDSAAPASPAAVETPAPVPNAAASPGRVSEYSTLGDCRVTTSKPEEAGFSSSECPGAGGFALRLIDADARQNLFVKMPSGAEHSLKLSEVVGSGFSRIGERIEWRGTMEGRTFNPDAMVLRYYVVEREGAGETAYLLPVTLAANQPCVADRLAPGADQSEQARRVVDSPMACLKR